MGRVLYEAKCIGCKCTDSRACECGCSWLIVDYKIGKGVCSSCPGKVEEFKKKHGKGEKRRLVPLTFRPVKTSPAAKRRIKKLLAAAGGRQAKRKRA